MTGSYRDSSYSEKILKGIYENLPISISRLNRQGYIIESKGSICSRNNRNQYPSDHDESDESRFNFFEYFPHIRPRLEALIHTGGVLSFETKITNTDETTKYLSNYSFPLKNEAGDIELIIISLDITKDTVAKESLNKKNSELKAIFDAIPDVYFRMDYNGTILDYKSASVSQLYIPEELFIGKPMSSFLPNHLKNSINSSIEIVKRTQKLHTLEYYIPMGTTNRYFEARFFPLYVNEIIVIIREITDSVNYQDKLREKERLLLETQKIAQVFSFFWDLEENRVTWTDEFYNMIQKKPSEVENTPDGFLEFVHPDDREKVILEIQNTLRYRTDLYVEYRFLLPGNKLAYLMSEGKLKLDKNGNPIQMLGLNQDITQRKEYELELLTQKRELEGLLENIEGIISQKTAELVLAKENAEKANTAKTLFLANMSHELKTPIHAIMSFAELGKEKVDKMDSERIKEYFSIIHESGNRLYRLMSNILDLSKMDSGNETYEFTTGDIYELTQKIIQEQQGLYKKKNLTINFEKNTPNTVLLFDYSKITQVVRNLLSNAIKFSPENSTIKIELSSGSYAFSNKKKLEPSIMWKVIDAGSGIDINEKELIFEKFEQGKKVKAGTGGSGLGLAICKEIIAGHRGIIYAENNPKQGAEFAFLIPQNQEI